MERDFLVTRVFLIITGMVLIFAMVMYYLDENSISSPKQRQVTGSMPPFETPTDSTGAGFQNTIQK